MLEATFVIYDVLGARAIECLLCGARSSHPSDIQNRYCARCHLFHDLVATARGLSGPHDCGEWRTGGGRCAVCDRALPAS